MNITINAKPYQMEESSNLMTVLEKAKIINRFGIAIAVNNTVVPKTEWEKFVLKDKDNIIIINAISGG
jgi:sulfur carrier protein